MTRHQLRRNVPILVTIALLLAVHEVPDQEARWEEEKWEAAVQVVAVPAVAAPVRNRLRAVILVTG